MVSGITVFLVTKVILLFFHVGLCVKARFLFIPFGSHLGVDSMMQSMIGSRVIT